MVGLALRQRPGGYVINTIHYLSVNVKFRAHTSAISGQNITPAPSGVNVEKCRCGCTITP
jgi:hypothetical protein